MTKYPSKFVKQLLSISALHTQIYHHNNIHQKLTITHFIAHNSRNLIHIFIIVMLVPICKPIP